MAFLPFRLFLLYAILVKLVYMNESQNSEHANGRNILVSMNENHVDQIEEEDDDIELPCGDSQVLSLSRKLILGTNKHVWIIDNSLNQCEFRKWLRGVNNHNYFNGYSFNKITSYQASDISYTKHAPWSTSILPEQLFSIPSWEKLNDFIQNILEKKVKVIFSNLELLRAMDPKYPTSFNECSKDRYILSVFLNPMWNLNDYGQVTFYKKNVNNSSLEIIETVHPHPYRSILQPSCSVVLFRAPCINHMTHFKMINVWLTTNMTDDPEIKSLHNHAEMKKKFSDFTFTNPLVNIDFSKHLVRSFHDGNPLRRVHIFDNCFTTDELESWLNHLLHTRPSYNEFDASPLEDHDNVQWITSFEVEAFMQTEMWPRLEALCQFVSNHSGWTPYDVALNYVRFADHTRIHPDSETHQDELTLLLYLNNDFTPSDFGETTFYIRKPYDDVHRFIGDGGEMYEAIGAVAPKYGRLVVFTNNIEHSAHPPSSQYLGTRYTFAVKVARSKRLSLIKRVYESMESIKLNKKMRKLKSMLETGKLDTSEKISTEKLEKLLEQFDEQKKLFAQSFQ